MNPLSSGTLQMALLWWQCIFPPFLRASSCIACKRFLCGDWLGEFSELGIVLMFPVESFIRVFASITRSQRAQSHTFLFLSCSSWVFSSPSFSSSAHVDGWSVFWFFFGFFFGCTLAYGSSQARDWIYTAAAATPNPSIHCAQGLNLPLCSDLSRCNQILNLPSHNGNS